MVIIVGIYPATYIAARDTLSDQISELDWAGGLTGQPLDCIEGEVTGLPFPARPKLSLKVKFQRARPHRKDRLGNGRDITPVEPGRNQSSPLSGCTTGMIPS